MNRDDVIRMAREADFGDGIVEFIGVQKFEHFAALVAAATAKEYEERLRFTQERWEIECKSQVEIEREACAKVCDELETCSDAEFYGHEFAAAIRARGNI